MEVFQDLIRWAIIMARHTASPDLAHLKSVKWAAYHEKDFPFELERDRLEAWVLQTQLAWTGLTQAESIALTYQERLTMFLSRRLDSAETSVVRRHNH